MCVLVCTLGYGYSTQDTKPPGPMFFVFYRSFFFSRNQEGRYQTRTELRRKLYQYEVHFRIALDEILDICYATIVGTGALVFVAVWENRRV